MAPSSDSPDSPATMDEWKLSILQSFPQPGDSVFEVRAWVQTVLKLRGFDEMDYGLRHIPWTGSDLAGLKKGQVNGAFREMLWNFPISAEYVANDIYQLIQEHRMTKGLDWEGHEPDRSPAMKACKAELADLRREHDTMCLILGSIIVLLLTIIIFPFFFHR